MTRQLPQIAREERYLGRVEDAHATDPVARVAHVPLLRSDPGQIGRYRLTARLGTGGMGVVYLGVAEDGRLVAVKVLHPGLAGDAEFRARFGREVAMLARVQGPRVVRVIEAGTDACGPFLVTEYAAGPSLAGYIATSGPLGAGMLHRLAAGLAEAITVIHAAGVVHRDLKPSNVILAADGPKVIDFGIAQALDSVSLTRPGMTLGSVGFMAPEQIEGCAGPPADIFAWAVTVAYAASGQPPFGTGPTEVVLYRIFNTQPNLAAVPSALRPALEAALAKQPQDRPAAPELLDRLIATPAASVPRYARDAAPMVLSRPSPPTELRANRAGENAGENASENAGENEEKGDESPVPGPAASGPQRRGARPRLSSRRTAAVAVSALVVVAAAVLALALGVGRSPKAARLAGDQRASSSQPAQAAAFGTYPGQQGRGVFQTISRIVGYGNTIVTTGTQVSDGVVRQQFFASADGGATWRLSPVHAPGGGQVPLGYAATRLAGGPAGWVATGPEAIWTSPDGRSWTLAARHGITPQRPGDAVFVLTATADGFLAAGETQVPGGGSQAVIWTSRDGLTWQRATAAQAGLGQDATSISYAAASGGNTVISGTLGNGGWGTWLSTNGGTAWTQVSIPAGYGAANSISGLAAGGSGLIAVRPAAPGGAIAYFSPNGRTWQYSATIGAAGGFRPAVVKGSSDGFVVTGTNAAGDYLAYTSTGTGTTWRPTGSLGAAASYASALAPAAGPGGTVIAAGTTSAARTGQQAVLLRASAAGQVRPVRLAAIPGAVIPQVSVNALATAGAQQVAVGSADGYPAIWQKTAGGSWTLVSRLGLVSARPGLTALTSVTHGTDGWLAVGTPGPVAFTSANGTTWQPAAGSIASHLAGVVAVAAAAGPRGYAIVGKEIAPGGGCIADVWWSPDLAHWTRAHDVNDTAGSSQVLAVAADAHGFISAGSDEGRPAVWTTTGGLAWTTVDLPLPSGATSGVLQQIAISGDRVVALGQQVVAGVTRPLAELSVDGGATFTSVPFGPVGSDPAITALTADRAGFTAAVQVGTPGQRSVTAWTSANGTTWTPSTALPSGQQSVILTPPDR